MIKLVVIKNFIEKGNIYHLEDEKIGLKVVTEEKEIIKIILKNFYMKKDIDVTIEQNLEVNKTTGKKLLKLLDTI